SGISIGEAAGFALLERIADASAPQAGAVRLVGFGESSDAYHMSSPHPEGVGAALAMRKALNAAGLKPSEIDYVNLHGTATIVGDSAEDRGIVDVFGEAGTRCSSTKGYTGHTLGASGIIETVISQLCIEHGFLPSSPTTTELDPAIRCRYVADGGEQRVRRVMSNSFGFGGSNCSLILEAA
ncbi:MAG TPA: beta-ketoacyl-[acyl-carrier-protein] synthase II, partial [Stellaceae bacterium]|nr:beta-ketoacyl-[acyl-carrier-protein] synthase II [Stellaceae bacterium]